MKQRYKRARTPTILQMESLECGAAALGIVLAYYHCYVPLEKLRIDCGVSRDGSKANNILKAARCYGLIARGYRTELQELHDLPLPIILFWKFSHFLVLEGFGRNHVYLNDPASGPCKVTFEEFDEAFTGIALTFEPGPDFKKSGVKQRLLPVLRTFLSGSEGSLIYVLLAGIGILITGLVIPAFSRIFVDHILVKGQNWLMPLLLGMGLTLVLRTTLTWVQQSVLAKLETKLSIASSSRFMWHVLRLPVEFFNQRYAGEIKSRVGLNDKVAQLMSGQLATTLLNLMLVIFYLVVMFQYDVLLTLLSFGVALLNLVALLLISRHRIDANQRLLQERGKLMGTTYNGMLLIETFKATGTELDLFARWGGYQAKTLNTEQQLALSDQVLSGLPAFLSIFSMAAVLTVGSLRVMAGQITIGMLVAFQSLLTSFLAPINQFIALGATFQEVRGDLTRLDDVLRYELDPTLSTQTGLPKDEDQARLLGYLDLQGIEFGYNRLEDPLIEDFNLTLKPGSRVALVGASGSGKSTVTQLIAGLYNPWGGEILFDGKSREQWPREIMTNSLAMVSQDILLFEGTIRENLTLWDETVTEQSILKATKDAAIHDAITVRAGGYESPVEEDGHNFSGGQRQRLEIARALVKNPSIIILDEATSALDPITEQQIDVNLRRRGCTCLIVAHRLSTIRDCDEIIVMERGKIVQRGTHDELIAGEGPYSRLLATEEYETQKTKLESLLESL